MPRLYDVKDLDDNLIFTGTSNEVQLKLGYKSIHSIYGEKLLRGKYIAYKSNSYYRCPKCHRDLSVDDFPYRKDLRKNYWYCYDCTNQMNREYMKKWRKKKNNK